LIRTQIIKVNDVETICAERGECMVVTLNVARNIPARRPSQSLGQDREEGMLQPRSIGHLLLALRDCAVRLHFDRNETIFAEAEAAGRVFRVLSGTVRLCRHTPDGRRHIAEFVLPGEVFGIESGARCTFSAEALGEVTLTSYARTDFERLVATNASAPALLLRHVEENLKAAQHSHFVLSCQNAKERVASFFDRLARRMDVDAGQRLDLPMGRQDIADHLGLTIETVCRAITTLKSEGALVVPNAHQVILHPARRAALTAVAA
jgi:CRP/FNR family nitrogen fixation transcriptional regulator